MTRRSQRMSKKSCCASLAPAAVASMKGKSYLSLGGVSMGIAGSIVDHNFLSLARHEGAGCRHDGAAPANRSKIYDETELEMALAWADKHFRYGEDQNAEQYKRNETQSRAVLKESLLMAMCIRDMMQGNPKLAEKGWWRSRWATTPSPPVSVVSATGPINTPMAIPPKRCSTALLTGTGCANRLSLLPKTTASTAWPC